MTLRVTQIIFPSTNIGSCHFSTRLSSIKYPYNFPYLLYDSIFLVKGEQRSIQTFAVPSISLTFHTMCCLISFPGHSQYECGSLSISGNHSLSHAAQHHPLDALGLDHQLLPKFDSIPVSISLKKTKSTDPQRIYYLRRSALSSSSQLVYFSNPQLAPFQDHDCCGSHAVMLLSYLPRKTVGH